MYQKNKITNNSFEGREGLVYVRVSTKKQEIEGSGLISQEERCIRDLEQIGVPHIKTFPDSYSGGGDFMKRPAMSQLLEYIDQNPHKKFLVVFDDLKRFARDVKFHMQLRSAFEARNAELRCLNYKFDDSPEGRFIETIMAGQAELERLQNRRQVIQKQKARLEAGYWAFGSKKGYTMTKTPEHGKLSIPNADGWVLKEALEGFAFGVFVNKVDACRFLVAKKFWTKQSPEKYIDKFTNLLKDAFYCGFVEYPDWEVSIRTGKHKAIISREVFELNKKRLDELDSGIRIRKDTSDDFPLRGLIACADCKKHITGAWCRGRNKKHPYYYCQNKKCPSNWKVIKKKEVESEFACILKRSKMKKNVSELVEVVFNEVWQEEENNFTKKQAEVLQKKNTQEENIEEITSLILSSNSNKVREVYEKKIEHISIEIDSIENNILAQDIDLDIPYRTALNKSIGILEKPYDVWVKLDTKEKHNLFFFIFEEKLLYSVKYGYRTAQIPSAIRLFEEFVTTNSQDVEMGGNEPPCRR